MFHVSKRMMSKSLALVAKENELNETFSYKVVILKGLFYLLADIRFPFLCLFICQRYQDCWICLV